MARLIYAFLALALGTLVAGFLIRDSSIPLLVSIGLSALVLLLILVGTSRRLRRSQELEDEQEELASLQVVEIDAPDVARAETTVQAPASARRARGARRRAGAEDTQAMPALDEDATPEPEVTEVVEPPAKRSRRKAPAKAKAPRRKVGTIVEREPDAFPEFAVSDDEASDETVATAEPPVEADTAPPPRRARARRPAASAGSSTSRAVDRPVLSPKVWVIPGRSRYHTQDCRFAKGDTLREVTEATAIRRGYVACSVCDPGAGG